MAAPKKKDDGVLEVIRVEQHAFFLAIVGRSPLIHNRLSQKAARELLLPPGRKTAVQKATTLKHNPLEEFRASPYTFDNPQAPTLLGLPAASFKKAMMTAALDLPGAKKAQIGRLVYVEGDYVNIYGVPQLFMAAVRQADMARTPDIRSRAIVPQWACVLKIQYVKPLITDQAVANLLAAAGITAGVGDWRMEKGSGNYGLFEVVGEHDERFQAIVAAGGRAAQVEAMRAPACYDEESAELLSWYDEEVARRRLKGVAAA